GARAIIVESATGRIARAMVHFRPEVPVIAVVTSQLVCRKLSLNWGVTALIGEEKRTSDAITRQAMEKALNTGIVHKGDTVVVLSSNRTCPTSSTDSLNIRIL
ncbi:MAG: pyruvate kinase alpha/beta domain-containing protein, partial [Ruminococcus sp.]|nr:pyruvate kinase alpha/beta domain-containing protein [Ruminococcus sp.]